MQLRSDRGTSPVLIFGGMGMLGEAVSNEASNKGYRVIQVGHQMASIQNDDKVRAILRKFAPSTVINCAGLIGQHNPDFMMATNGIGPGILARACVDRNIRFFHVSTDCVFDGSLPVGRYNTPMTPATPKDDYGRSKRTGELSISLVSRGSNLSTIIRTSFIGYRHGLLHWLISQRNTGSVPGWVNAYWSGSTVYEVARGVVNLLKEQSLPRIVHLATAEPVDKATLLSALVGSLELPLEVKFVTEPFINRSLEPTHLIGSPLSGVILDELVREQSWVSQS